MGVVGFLQTSSATQCEPVRYLVPTPNHQGCEVAGTEK